MDIEKCMLCGGSLTTDDKSGMLECPDCGVFYETDGSSRKEPAKKTKQQKKQSPLVKRALLMCEDGDFEKAHEISERALDENPEDAEAYLVALMSDYRCRHEQDLGDLWTPTMTQNGNFKKAVRFGDGQFRAKLEDYAMSAQEPISNRLRFSIPYTDEMLLAIEKLRLMTKLSVAIETKVGKDLMKYGLAMGRALGGSGDGKAKEEMEDYEEALDNAEKECRDKIRIIESGRASLDDFEIDQDQHMIKWRVLTVDEESKRVLIIADECITEAPFHILPDEVSWKPIYKTWRTAELEEGLWENSTIRHWLNEDFYQSLPQELRDEVVQVRNSNPGNGTIAGRPATKDKVFLLSIEEASEFFAGDEDRDAGSVWWLRTQGQKVYDNKPTTTVVSWGGEIDAEGRSISPEQFTFTNVFDHAEGIRPAMWVRLRG